MIDFGLMGGIYAMLHAVHGIADYWFQTDWQAQNKSKNIQALGHHAIVYSFSFLPVAIALSMFSEVDQQKLGILPLVIGIPHAWMDRRRFLGWFLRTTKGWKPEDMATLSAPAVAVRTHVAIHMDQKFHYLCLLLTAAWLAWK